MFSQGIGFQSVYSTPGSGGTQTLQDITTNGNETNTGIILIDEFGNKIRINANESSFIVNKIFGDEETNIIQITDKGITLSEALETFQLFKENAGNALYRFPNNTVFELVASREWTALQLANKADLVGGKIPASQIPSGFDEILEYATFTAFPVVGQSNIYYVALDTNKTFRWGGSNYVIMNEGIALGETSSTAYRGDRGKTAYDHSQTSGNPHGTTAAQVGAYTKTEVDNLLLAKSNITNTAKFVKSIYSGAPATITETVIGSVQVGNAGNGSSFSFNAFVNSDKSNTSNAGTIKFYLNTVNNMTGSPIQIGINSATSALTIPLDRIYTYNAGTLYGFNPTQNAPTDSANGTLAGLALTVDLQNTTYYLIATMQTTNNATTINARVLLVNINPNVA